MFLIVCFDFCLHHEEWRWYPPKWQGVLRAMWAEIATLRSHYEVTSYVRDGQMTKQPRSCCNRAKCCPFQNVACASWRCRFLFCTCTCKRACCPFVSTDYSMRKSILLILNCRWRKHFLVCCFCLFWKCWSIFKYLLQLANKGDAAHWPKWFGDAIAVWVRRLLIIETMSQRTLAIFLKKCCCWKKGCPLSKHH